jgi:hypothetical protein
MNSFSFAFIALLGLISRSSSVPKEDGALPPPPESFNETIMYQKSERPHGVECATRDGTLTRNAIIGDRYRWRNFNVYIDPAYSDNEREMIHRAVRQIADAFTCITYGIWPKGGTPSGDYVHIKRNDYPSCWSYVGKRGGMQEMSMREECMYHALLVHEFLHAVGLEHEHSRFDRDDYVTIHYENVQPGLEHAFKKTSQREYDTHGVAYNQNSVMHYFRDSYSKNGQNTITSKRGGYVGMEWPSGKIQNTDVEKLKKMYRC